MSRSRVRIGFAALTCSPDTDHSEEPMRPGRFAARCSLALSLLVAMALGFASSAGSADPVPNPAVSGPIEGGVHGYPWNHSLFALRGPGYDYTEQEFFFSGMATDLSTGVQAPYESRMLVRLPRNPAAFSGIVTVEWLNVTGQMDLETSWPVEAQYLMGQGIGYVGVSAQLAGVCCGPTTLKGWDPVRYAPLEHPGDRFSYDNFAVLLNRPFPPGAVNPVVGERLHGFGNSFHRPTRKRNQVRIAIHKADPATVSHDLDNVSRKQKSLRLRATRPVQDSSTREMSSQPYQGHIILQGERLTRPERDPFARPHHPLPIRFVQVNRHIELFSPIHH